MENRTEAISSAAANFQTVSNRLGARHAEKKINAKIKEDSISDSIETSDSDSQGGASFQMDNSDQVNPATSKPDSNETGSILDISG